MQSIAIYYVLMVSVIFQDYLISENRQQFDSKLNLECDFGIKDDLWEDQCEIMT